MADGLKEAVERVEAVITQADAKHFAGTIADTADLRTILAALSAAEAENEKLRDSHLLRSFKALMGFVAGLRRQRDELHETANRYLERARAAEARERVKDQALEAAAITLEIRGLLQTAGIARRALALTPETPHAD